MEALYDPLSSPSKVLARRRSSSSDEPSPRGPNTPTKGRLKTKRSMVNDDFYLNQASSDFPLGGGVGKIDSRENGGVAFGGLKKVGEISEVKAKPP